jgi:hypothetical protein
MEGRTLDSVNIELAKFPSIVKNKEKSAVGGRSEGILNSRRKSRLSLNQKNRKMFPFIPSILLLVLGTR